MNDYSTELQRNEQQFNERLARDGAALEIPPSWIPELPPENPEIINIIADREMFPTINKVAIYEKELNNRERRLNSNRVYRVFPAGTILPDTTKNFKAVIECKHCGQFGAVGCACPHCGAPIKE